MQANTIEVLKNGGLIIHPSDTVYGLLCDATNVSAVNKLLAFKERPAGKPISIFVSDLEMAKEYVYINKANEKRLKAMLPGPYTIVLPSKHNVVKSLESEKGTLGIRIPKYQRIIDLVKKFGKPLTATSANLSTRSPHYSVKSLKKQTAKKRLALVDHIVDSGELPHNRPSTVVDFTTDELMVLRKGEVMLPSANVFFSKSEDETKEIAKELVEGEIKNLKKPLVFVLQGDLGAGKTNFAKGIGEALSVEKIISPTFVVYYEYPILLYPHLKTFIHADLYNVTEKSEFHHLGLTDYLKTGVIMAIEWGDKLGDLISEIKSKAHVIGVTIEHVEDDKRKIAINEL